MLLTNIPLDFRTFDALRILKCLLKLCCVVKMHDIFVVLLIHTRVQPGILVILSPAHFVYPAVTAWSMN